MLVVGTCDGERHERTGAQKMHRHEHTVVQHWRGLWLDDHYALFVRRCQQSETQDRDRKTAQQRLVKLDVLHDESAKEHREHKRAAAH